MQLACADGDRIEFLDEPGHDPRPAQSSGAAWSEKRTLMQMQTTSSHDTNESDHDQINGNNVIQQSRNEENQYTRNQGHDGANAQMQIHH